MTQISQSTGLIRPFNLDSDEYDNMYNGPLPDRLRAILFVDSVLSIEKVMEELDDCLRGETESEDDSQEDVETDNDEPISLEPESVGLTIIINLDYCSVPVWRQFSAWGGIMPFSEEEWDMQLAFLVGNEAGFGLPLGALMATMDVHDYLCQISGSLESADHSPIPTSARDAELFELLVGNIYRRNWGFMNRQLIEYRNKVLITAGALQLCLDPKVEYDRFIKAGGKHYIEYPSLCQ